MDDEPVTSLEELRLANRLHLAEVDAVMRALAKFAAEDGHPVQCGAGCSACCSLWVEIGPLDALEIADELRRQGRAGRAVRNRLEQAGQVMAAHDAEGYWKLGRPCELLAKDGRCSTYHARPVSCRLHQSTTGREMCATASGERVETASILREHMAFSAEAVRHPALKGWPASGPLPAMVARALAIRS